MGYVFVIFLVVCVMLCFVCLFRFFGVFLFCFLFVFLCCFLFVFTLCLVVSVSGLSIIDCPVRFMLSLSKHMINDKHFFLNEFANLYNDGLHVNLCMLRVSSCTLTLLLYLKQDIRVWLYLRAGVDKKYEFIVTVLDSRKVMYQVQNVSVGTYISRCLMTGLTGNKHKSI